MTFRTATTMSICRFSVHNTKCTRFSNHLIIITLQLIILVAIVFLKQKQKLDLTIRHEGRQTTRVGYLFSSPSSKTIFKNAAFRF